MTGELGSCLTPPLGVERVVGFFVGTVAGHRYVLNVQNAVERRRRPWSASASSPNIKYMASSDVRSYQTRQGIGMARSKFHIICEAPLGRAEGLKLAALDRPQGGSLG